MKKYLFILFFLFSCASEKDSPPIEKEKFGDTAKMLLIKDLYDLERSLQQVYETDSLSYIEIERNKFIIDSLIQECLDDKGNKLDLVVMRIRFDNIKSKYKSKLDSLSKDNEFLKFQNVVAQQKIDKQKKDYDRLSLEASMLFDSLNRVTDISVENIKFECIGSSFLDAEFVTNKSNKIKYIKFCASIPKNKKIGSYLLRVEVFSTDKKNIIYKEDVITYDGKEKNIIFKLNVDSSFKKGEHISRVYLNHKMIYETSIKIN